MSWLKYCTIVTNLHFKYSSNSLYWCLLITNILRPRSQLIIKLFHPNKFLKWRLRLWSQLLAAALINNTATLFGVAGGSLNQLRPWSLCVLIWRKHLPNVLRPKSQSIYCDPRLQLLALFINNNTATLVAILINIIKMWYLRNTATMIAVCWLDLMTSTFH